MDKKKFIRTFVNAVFWFLLALFFAATYATLEGNKPWATNLNPWRPDPSLSWVKMLYWVPNLGRSVNGFDTFGITLLCFFGLLLVPIWEWAHNRSMELSEFLELTVYFAAICVIEDWVWYAINPYFGFAKFAPAYTSGMYSAWLLGFPSQYWEGFFLALLLSVFAFTLKRQEGHLKVKPEGWKGGLQFFATVWGTMIILSLIANSVAQLWRH